MTSSLLSRLSATPNDVANLSRGDSRAAVRFFLRWEAYQDALDCLALIDDVNEYVTWQDLLVEALLGVGQNAEATALMESRVQQRDSATARQQLATCYRRTGAADKAVALINSQLSVSSANPQLWGVLGDILLENNDLDGAEDAFLRFQQLAPNSRNAQIGLMHVRQRRGDVVGASAYAVRAFTVSEGDAALTVRQLQDLRRFFAANEDANRLQDANELLVRLFDAELDQISDLLKTRSARRKAASHAPPPTEVQPIQPTHTPAEVPVSTAENAELEAATRRLFGFSSLLSAQPQIMAAARRGEDVLAVLPTGAGKSLCYQLPAFLDNGVTLVISPLIALMKDQVESLPDALRRQTIAINSTLDGNELRQAIDAIAAGRYKLIYAAPERLRQQPFLDMLRRSKLARLVIDEAHCVSVWGHDFRPDYLNLAQAHGDLGAPPILALTATAPPQVRQDIEHQLFGKRALQRQMRVIVADTYRANLHLSAIKVKDDDEKLMRLTSLCKALPGSGIVYARSRAKCEELAEMLRSQGVNAIHYHAGSENRAEIQDRFMTGQARVIVATVAFGMGVDKADIRFIIHYGPPNSVEAYYQEAGRAGRDGKPAHCVMLFSTRDRSTLSQLANQSRLDVDFLRKVYGGVRQGMGGRNPGALALDNLVRTLQVDDTAVRVALSLLEEAGLLRRHYDTPRSIALWLLRPNNDARLRSFAETAKIGINQATEWGFLELASALGVLTVDLEQMLLDWQHAGLLSFRSAGRDALISLLDAPHDATRRIEGLIERHAAIQDQRVTEIFDYARTKRCRHGHLAGYLGGHARTRCENCDNCGVHSLPDSNTNLPDEQTQQRVILSALQQQGWGKRTLTRLLRGEDAAGDRARRSTGFGVLAYRSERAIEAIIDELIDQGLIDLLPLSHGGVALQLTQQGARWLANNSVKK